jgi:1-deoxy-D-xylulose-5-phosphate synthase
MKKNVEFIDIKSIKNPNFVKNLDYKSITALCHDIREEIIHETSLYGGHLSSNLGVVELTVSLYRSFNFPTDKLIFDVGHQCYTHKILTGRSLDHLRQKGFVSGFEDRDESVYDCYEAGHSGTAISAAEGFAIARERKHGNYNIVAVVGDASIVNGLSFEALNNLGSRREKVIIVLNDNDMSISRPVGGLGKFFRSISTQRGYNKVKTWYKTTLNKTKLGHHIYNFSYWIKSHVKAALVPTTMFDNIGLTYIGPIDGHDINALDRAFRKAKNTTKSTIVHVYTTKGKGYGPAERDQIGYWHGVTPFTIATGKPLDMHEGQFSWSHFMGECVHEVLKERPDVELVVPAMIRGSGLDDCFADFPDQCVDVGIAEEHAITLAGSLSINGIHPIVAIYSTFLQRAYDELSHDCARLGANITLLIDRAGLVGPNGETHQGLYDEAFLKSIPNVVISMPSTLEEAKGLLNLSLSETHGVFAIRYPHSLTAVPERMGTSAIEFGKWLSIKKAENGCYVLGVGPMGHALCERLRKENSPWGFVNPLFLYPLEQNAIRDLAHAHALYVYDPYGTREGFAESLESALFANGFRGLFVCRTAPTAFVQHASLSDQLTDNGLTVSQAFSELSSLL